MSDRSTGIATLEQRMDDVRAEIDAVGSTRVALMGVSEGGPMCILFAATYPERTSALITYSTVVNGVKNEESEKIAEEMARDWPDSVKLEHWAPSIADNEHQQWFSRYLRMSASPGAVLNLARMNMEIDVRPVRPAVHELTLVLHRTGDRAIPASISKYAAEQIPDAKFVELKGNDHYCWVGDSDAIINEVQEFLTRTRQKPEPDRVLATVMFTDIVGFTEHAVRVGDQQWRDLLDAHNTLLRGQITRFRGQAIKSTGDGFMATFDGPARAIRCACAISEAVHRLGINVRAGLHTGEIEKMGDDIGGVAVHIGARVAAAASANEVLVSHTVKDLVAGSGLRFQERGIHTLKGIPGEWTLFGIEKDVSSPA